MIDSTTIKHAFVYNWPNTILLGIVWFTLNGKMNKILINEGIHDTKIEQLDRASAEHNSIVARINLLETKFAGHIGDAYMREEDD